MFVGIREKFPYMNVEILEKLFLSIYVGMWAGQGEMDEEAESIMRAYMKHDIGSDVYARHGELIDVLMLVAKEMNIVWVNGNK